VLTPHEPSATHVWIPFARQRLLPGAQRPTHSPSTHAWLVQEVKWLLQLPSDPQLCTALPEHWSEPGVHAPEHVPFVQAMLEQGDTGPQAPLASHVCTPLPEHRVAPGAQAPLQAPSMQAWFEQGIGAPHMPLGPHVSSPSSEHCVAPGLQTPLQPPSVHAASGPPVETEASLETDASIWVVRSPAPPGNS
jgi:hypothetical protein